MAAFNLASKMAAKLSFQSFLSSLDITGRLPEAGNLKPNITRPPPEKTCAAMKGMYTKASR